MKYYSKQMKYYKCIKCGTVLKLWNYKVSQIKCSCGGKTLKNWVLVSDVMETTMETLSDKACISKKKHIHPVYHEKNVKAFIKELKLLIDPCDHLIVKINELAGKKLIS